MGVGLGYSGTNHSAVGVGDGRGVAVGNGVGEAVGVGTSVGKAVGAGGTTKIGVGVFVGSGVGVSVGSGVGGNTVNSGDGVIGISICASTLSANAPAINTEPRMRTTGCTNTRMACAIITH